MEILLRSLLLVILPVSSIGISREAGEDIEINCTYDQNYIGKFKELTVFIRVEIVSMISILDRLLADNRKQIYIFWYSFS